MIKHFYADFRSHDRLNRVRFLLSIGANRGN